MRPDEIWEGTGPAETAVRIALTPLSWLYAFGWQAYLAAYRIGFKKSKEPHRPVICVGNLVTGGSGKSPVTLALAQVLSSMGKQVVIGCSGYGAPHSADAEIAPEGPLNASLWGDEPAMFRWLLPDVPLVVGRNRVLAAQVVHERFPNAVLLMDDGFQHLPLKKQGTLILDEPTQNTMCMPAGPYREPRGNRRRADRRIPDDFQIDRRSLRFVNPDGDEVKPSSYSVLCALGQPRRFLSEVADQLPNAAREPATSLVPDHDRLDALDLFKQLPPGVPIVVTAKDWVKLKDRGDVNEHEIVIALQNVKVEPLERLKSWLESVCNE